MPKKFVVNKKITKLALKIAKIMEVNTLELKNDLHTLVTNTDDENVLFRVKEFFTELKDKDDWWHLLTPTQKNQIEIGSNQLDNGIKFTHNEVRAEIDKLLLKK